MKCTAHMPVFAPAKVQGGRRETLVPTSRPENSGCAFAHAHFPCAMSNVKTAAEEAAAAFLASLGGAPEATKPKKKKAKGKKKGGAAGEGSDDEGGAGEAGTGAPDAPAPAGDKAAAEGGDGAAVAPPGEGGDEAWMEEGGGEGATGDGKAKPKKAKGKKEEKVKKPSAAAKMVLEMQERKRQEEERIAKELAEQKRIEEEEARIAKEAEDARLAKIAARKERERLKIEQEKRDGTYRTAAQKAKDAANKIRLEQMIKAGMVQVGESAAPEAAAVEDKPKKKPVYGGKPKKKGPGGSSGGGEAAAATDAAPVAAGPAAVNWEDDEDDVTPLVDAVAVVGISDATPDEIGAGMCAAFTRISVFPCPMGVYVCFVVYLNVSPIPCTGSPAETGEVAGDACAAVAGPVGAQPPAAPHGGAGGSRKPLEQRIEESRKRRLVCVVWSVFLCACAPVCVCVCPHLFLRLVRTFCVCVRICEYLSLYYRSHCCCAVMRVCSSRCVLVCLLMCVSLSLSSPLTGARGEGQRGADS